MRYSKFILILVAVFGCMTDEGEDVVTLPLAPTNLSVQLVTATQANLTWTDNSTNETGFKIMRKQTGGQYSNIATVNADVTFYNDIGLTPGESYTYSVYAFNNSGNSATYSNEVTIKTESTAILTTTNVTSITTTSAISGGAITADGGASVTARGVCWSTSQNPTISNNKTTDGNGEGLFISNITGLLTYTTYYVRAYATNSVGTAYGNEVSFTTGAFTDDRDGTVYKTVKIGNQTWMAENLKYLPSVTGPSIESKTIPYHYVYGYDGTNVADAKATSNYSTYGVLYNWSAAMNGEVSSSANPSGVQGVCPTGWHLPSDAEWTQLTDYLGGESIAGGKLKEAGTAHWISPNTDATNETGFTALAAGWTASGKFQAFGKFSSWWSSSEESAERARDRIVETYSGSVFRGSYNKDNSSSLRCIKD
jgi:uncharacterized protein (TIGR02145 family)